MDRWGVIRVIPEGTIHDHDIVGLVEIVDVDGNSAILWKDEAARRFESLPPGSLITVSPTTGWHSFVDIVRRNKCNCPYLRAANDGVLDNNLSAMRNDLSRYKEIVAAKLRELRFLDGPPMPPMSRTRW